MVIVSANGYRNVGFSRTPYEYRRLYFFLLFPARFSSNAVKIARNKPISSLFSPISHTNEISYPYHSTLTIPNHSSTPHTLISSPLTTIRFLFGLPRHRDIPLLLFHLFSYKYLVINSSIHMWKPSYFSYFHFSDNVRGTLKRSLI